MFKRMLLMLAVTLLIVAGLGFVKFRQIQAAIAEGAAYQPPPEAVTTIIAAEEAWPATLNAVGTVAAVQGVMVSADLPGIVERIEFQSGRIVRRGDVLVKLDTRQEEAQLEAAQAQLELARLNYERMKALVAEDAVSRAEYDRAAAEAKQAEARIGEIKATIARKTIRAPFSGVLGIRQANLGQYLSGGDAVVPLQSLHPIYVNFGVPQQDVAKLRVGREVRVVAEDLGGAEFTGRITAINSVVDPTTRNVEVQATLANKQGWLRPGMFVQAQLDLGVTQAVVPLPASAISYAPYGDSVYVVTEMKGEEGMTFKGVRQQVVKLGPSRGDQVAVLSGIKPGEEVVTSGVFKLRNGAAVTVNNAVQPSNSKTPTPTEG
ncbi:MAG TPA: efflux RND transporter periplasmic adaptor subunit [Vicinamibacterales bacterium]|nr:efflux RND transporter periplasmic adaptor subunit [Vicinamibacterales bacterium]